MYHQFFPEKLPNNILCLVELGCGLIRLFFFLRGCLTTLVVAGLPDIDGGKEFLPGVFLHLSYKITIFP